MWMFLILFILASVGATGILVDEYVFKWLRDFMTKKFPNSPLTKLVTCRGCSGFWVGVIFSFIFPPFISFLPLNALICGCISYICNMVYIWKIEKI